MPYSKYSAKQKRLAAVAPPRKKITAADINKLERRRNGRSKKRATRRVDNPSRGSTSHCAAGRSS